MSGQPVGEETRQGWGTGRPPAGVMSEQGPEGLKQPCGCWRLWGAWQEKHPQPAATAAGSVLSSRCGGAEGCPRCGEPTAPGPSPREPTIPRGVRPAEGKGLTLDLPGSLIKPRPLETPVAGLGRRSLPPCPLAPRQPPTGFHLLTGGRFTADHPGPSTRL